MATDNLRTLKFIKYGLSTEKDREMNIREEERGKERELGARKLVLSRHKFR